MNTIYYRTATLDDLPILLEFEQGIIETERPYDKTLKFGYITYYNIKEMILSKNTEVVVAVLSNKIIGSAYANIRKAEPYLNHSYYAYLGFMYVAPEQRGKGINKGIIEFLFDWIKQKNITEVELDVYNDNSSAIKAYEKAGFKKHMINMRMKI